MFSTITPPPPPPPPISGGFRAFKGFFARFRAFISAFSYLRVFAAVALFCGAAFSSPAFAQSAFDATISLNPENGQVTWRLINDGGSSAGAYGCCAARQSADESVPPANSSYIGTRQSNGLSPHFISGGTPNSRVVSGATAVYDIAAAFDSGDFDFSKPFMIIRPLAAFNFYSNPLRVAGITGGTATIEKNGQLLSVNISGLRNVVGRAPIPQELSFQWQVRNTGSSNAWFSPNIGIGQTYTLNAANEGRLILTDKAGLRAVQTINTPTEAEDTVESCNMNEQIFSGGSCVSCPSNMPVRNVNSCEAAPVTPEPTPTPTPTPPTTSGGTSSTASDDNVILYAGGGVVALLAIVSFYQSDVGGGGTADFSFSPAYDYSFTESGYAYNVGGRMDYQRDNLKLFWTATQEHTALGGNANGDFSDLRYSSGAEYESDRWAAAFSESVAGKVADYDFSLSAFMNGKTNGESWKISSVYRLNSRFEDLKTGWESESKNALNLEGVLTFRGWELKPSAGFQWQNAEKFGTTAKFGLEGAFNYNRWHIKTAAGFQMKTDNKPSENAQFNLEVIRRF